MGETNPLVYHLKKPFTRLPLPTAKKLAKATVYQLEEKGFKGVGYRPIYEAIEAAFIHPDSTKMQFSLPKEGYEQEIFDPEGIEVFFLPRRVITTYPTAYKTTPLMEGFKEWRKAAFTEKVRGFDSSHVCRMAREDSQVGKVFEKALERKVRYALMGTFITSNDDGDGRILHDENGKVIRYTRAPWIIVPGATKEEIRTLDDFCANYQVPSPETLARLTGARD